MKQFIKSYAIIALGSLIFALGFDWFFAPNQIAMGGVTGLAQVINVLIPALPVGVLTIILNIPLFLAGWKLIGFHLLASSLFSMAVSSVAIDVIAAWYTFPPMDPLLACLCGGAVMGAGFGLVFAQGATTGGTDIVARLLKLRFPWLPMGKLLLVPDGVVLALAAVFLVFSALLNLFLGLKMPNLHWTSEITPIKQSGAVAIALLGGWAYAAAMAVLYFLVGRHMGFAAYMAAFLALTLAAAVLLYIWVRKKGCAIFASL